MRNFFGDLCCECESLELLRFATTTPDATMEITGVVVVCVDCDATFHDVHDEHALGPIDIASPAELDDLVGRVGIEPTTKGL